MHDNQLKELSGRTVLVTGGAGLIGSRITALLRRLGARPVVLCKLDAYPSHVYRDLLSADSGNPDIVQGDILNADLVQRAVAGADYVVHAAALADVAACTRMPMEAISTNITGTQVVLDAVGSHGHIRRLLFVSSASVYGDGAADVAPPDEYRSLRELLRSVYGQLPSQFAESTPLRPKSVYANAKAWGERQTALTLSDAQTSYAIVRYFSVYGEPQVIKQGSHSWVVAWFAARAALGMPLHLNGGGCQIRDLVHVDDVASASVRALVAPGVHNTVINVGTGRPTSVRRVAELIAERHPRTRLIQTPAPAGDPIGGYAATYRMETALGWRPSITLEEGVVRYTEWLKRTPAAIPSWLRAEGSGFEGRLR
ncbi:NAD-dependent epimerase/dehydratase family protein [Streptomyces uncialis]|uniref:NAD-dependent epimerase/dehydratase family protein n=1 Tax=Streptomyces uncialis TaxID=1048205 RepID=UPI00365411DC